MDVDTSLISARAHTYKIKDIRRSLNMAISLNLTSGRYIAV